jgi:hypothetical protein
MTIAQSEDTCVVSGMPRAAILKGYANKVIPLEGLANYLVTHFHSDRSYVEKAEKTEKLDRQEKNEKQDRNERTPVSSNRT